MREREYNMDYLRIFACFMVIFLHVAAQNWSSVEVTGKQWHVFNLYNSAVRSSVPLFLMLSGKLLLSHGDDFSMKKFFSKNIKKLLIVYLVWAFLYAVDTVGIAEILKGNYRNLIACVVGSKFHLWYLSTLISIYLLLPLFMGLIKYQGGRYVPYACILFLIWGVGKEFLMLLFPENLYLKRIFKDFTYALGDLSGYFLLGYALDKYTDRFAKIKTGYLAAALAVIIMIAAKAGELAALAAGKPKSIFFGYLALPVCVEAILIFTIFLRLPKKLDNPKAAGIIAKLSKYTLFVYLFHIFVMEHLNIWFHINSLICNPWLSVPLYSVFLFAVCMAGAWIVETVVLLDRKKSTEDMVYAYVDYEPEDDAYLQGMKGNATYREIKEWIKAEYGMSVSSLYVAQIKDKCGFEKRQNYNIGENKAHVPNCPPEKEKVILKAFKHFRMV